LPYAIVGHCHLRGILEEAPSGWIVDIQELGARHDELVVDVDMLSGERDRREVRAPFLHPQGPAGSTRESDHAGTTGNMVYGRQLRCQDTIIF
jgi:hypothetical protein